MLTPAIRAMCMPVARVRQPCRCLWRGSLQMTRTTPLRRTILQLRQIFFTEASTFISASPLGSLGAENDPRARQVIGGQIDRHLVARQDLDVVHPHLSRNVPQYH